jgi:hypothetical protein
LKSFLLESMDFTFIKQAICEEKAVKVYVSIMTRKRIHTEQVPPPENSDIQEILEIWNGRKRRLKNDIVWPMSPWKIYGDALLLYTKTRMTWERVPIPIVRPQDIVA